MYNIRKIENKGVLFLVIRNQKKYLNLIVARAMILGVLGVSIMGCQATKSDIKKNPVQIKKLGLASIVLSQKTINTTKEEKAVIKLRPKIDCYVSISIADQYGRYVNTIAENVFVSSKESMQFVWDGKDCRKKDVARGVYYYVVKMQDLEGTNITYNPYMTSQGFRVNATGSYDSENQLISYQLPQASQVRIRIGIREGGPLLLNLLNWTPHEAGSHSISWDGMDTTKTIEIMKHPNHFIMIYAYSLADNSIIVENSQSSREEDFSKDLLFKPVIPQDRYRHAVKGPSVANEPRVFFDFPQDTVVNEDNVPILSGTVPIKISLHEDDKEDLLNTRYEIMIYTDAVFLFEDESGFSPFTYQLDTTRLSEGVHALTVNILSYDDQSGVMTKKFIVNNNQ